MKIMGAIKNKTAEITFAVIIEILITNIGAIVIAQVPIAKP